MNKIPANMIGCSLHTALRKACDSTVTSLAWNYLNFADDAWSTYLKLVKPDWERVKTRTEALELLKESAEDLPNLKTVTSELMTLHLIFKLFDEKDWEGFATYLEWEDET